MAVKVHLHTSRLLKCSLLFGLGPYAVSNSNHLTEGTFFFFLLTDDNERCHFSFSSVYHDGRGITFIPELTEPHCDESQSEVEDGRGRDRLLHMSVAMGILAQ